MSLKQSNFRLLSFLILAGSVSAQQSPSLLFQAGLYAEEIRGDLAEALSCYEKIVTDYPDERPLAAKALLQMGFCYEKLGDKRAENAFRRITGEYPDQRQTTAAARDRLKRIQQSKIRNRKSQIEIHPLTRHYFERLGIDLLTATSYDGQYFAYTDWTTGSLIIKNLKNPKSQIPNPQSEIRIVKADFSRSHEYAYYPAFSRDSQTLAYSWYRAPYWIELRTVSLVDGTVKVVYSKPGLVLNPHDWTPDGRTIVCETLDYDREILKWLGLVDVATGELRQLRPLWRQGRGFKVSPDGRYVVYDLRVGGKVNIFVLDLQNHEQSQDLFYSPGNLVGWDAPVWSPDGAVLLARNQGSLELWAQPVKNGRRSGPAYRIQANLPKAILTLTGVDHATEPGRHQASKTESPHGDVSFKEEFDTPNLDPAWSVFRWHGPNVYGYQSFGRISLTDHPGHLRYYLDPIMQTTIHSYRPQFSGWYWLYPALELRRPLYGRHWTLETRVTYFLVDGANGRHFSLAIVFGKSENRSILRLGRGKDIEPGRHGVSAAFLDQGVPLSRSETFLSPADTSGLAPFTYVYRLTRVDSLLRVEVSDDEGQHFQQLLSMTLRPGLREQPQTLILAGNSWFAPAGAYADWDYIRFRVLEE